MPSLKNFILNLTVAVLSPILIVGGLEWGFRTFASSRVKTYFDQQTELVLGNPPAPKKAGEYRIFIFGGSSAYGFPVADRYSITAWIRKSSPYLFPGKTVRMVNTAWPGKASYHSLEGARTVLKYKPDLFIIYCGHNEVPVDNRLFADSWIYRLDLHMRFRSTFYRYLSLRFDRLRKHFVYGRSGYAEKQYREEVIASKIYQNKSMDDKEYENILFRYQKNMEEIMHLAKRHGVDVIFLTLPSNIREILPSVSLHRPGLSETEKSKWENYFEGAQKAEQAGEMGNAEMLYENALKIDPQYAELQYRFGIFEERMGRYPEAKQALTRARDLDGYPTRAKSSMNELLRKWAPEHGAMLADIVKLLEKLSEHGIISSQLIYDNVHPTVQAQQIIVDEIFRVLAENNKIVPRAKWQWEALERAKRDINSEEWKVDGSVNAYRFILTGLHFWEQQRYDAAAGNLEKGLQAMPGFHESYAFLGDAYFHLGSPEKAAKAFETLEQKDPSLLKILKHKYPELQETYSRIFSTAESKGI